MAQNGVQLDRETFSCSICLDLLKGPATIPCGHSYCMDCIKTHWDDKGERKLYSCPQCGQSFTPRPVLVKNTMLAALAEELMKTGAAADDLRYAGPEDVVCDVCPVRKLKAHKSCLVCRISYCQKHLQLHYDSPAFEKHKLVEPYRNLQENICSRHDEVKKMFCRTEQLCICYLCSVDEHKDHATVTAATERIERQEELKARRKNIQQRIQAIEKDRQMLEEEVEAINHSADKTVEDTEKIFIQLIHLMAKRSSDVMQQIRSQQEAEVSRVKEFQEKLEQEITELKRRDAEVEELSSTEDHNQFLHNYITLPPLRESTAPPSLNIRPLRYFEDVTAAVSEARDKLQDLLKETRTNISLMMAEMDVLLSEPEPKTREGFLRYSCDITLDPNTVHTLLLLSEGNRKVTLSQKHHYSSHPERFTYWFQALSRESLTGRCYWEVERTGDAVHIAVSYKSINRAGSSDESRFGLNDKSWVFECFRNGYRASHNNVKTPVSGPQSSRLGVYLDQRAGTLSFYSITKNITLLHRVQTTFTQPLYAGLWVPPVFGRSSVEFCKLN